MSARDDLLEELLDTFQGAIRAHVRATTGWVLPWRRRALLRRRDSLAARCDAIVRSLAREPGKVRPLVDLIEEADHR